MADRKFKLVLMEETEGTTLPIAEFTFDMTEKGKLKFLPPGTQIKEVIKNYTERKKDNL